jgi:cell volume regulation protein A
VPSRAGPVERIELELPGRGDHEIVAYVVHPESAVAQGQRIPRWARPSLIVRDGRTLRPHRFGRPQAGDQIYVITTPEYIGLLDRLFGGRPPGSDDPSFYGEFALSPDIRLGDIARSYAIRVAAGDENLTVGELLRRELAGDIEPGDRISLGAVDVIVRRVSEDHEVLEVGLAMEHAESAVPRIPLFQSPHELAELIRSWLPRVRTKASQSRPPPADDQRP